LLNQQALQELQIAPIQQSHMNPTGPIPKKPSDSEDFNYNDVENNDYEEEEDYPQEYEEYEYLINQKKKMFE
jgi:hypothetical protein